MQGANRASFDAMAGERRDGGPDLPEPIATFVHATNTGNREALLGVFADRALVIDDLREYREGVATGEWADERVFAQRLRIAPQDVIAEGDQVTLRGIVDGDFDKRGLPHPLVLSFYFSVRLGRIVQLVILRNESDDE
jgi:SnoaL-like domain